MPRVKKLKSKKIKITKDMTFIEVIKKYPETTETFLEHGLACIGCPFAMQETIEQGAKAHGINLKKLIKELNKTIEKKEKKKIKDRKKENVRIN